MGANREGTMGSAISYQRAFILPDNHEIRKRGVQCVPAKVLVLAGDFSSDQGIRCGFYVLIHSGCVEEYGGFLGDDEPLTHEEVGRIAKSTERWKQSIPQDLTLKSILPPPRLLTRSYFIQRMYQFMREGCMVVGHELHVLLSRLSLEVGAARGVFKGGFSLTMCHHGRSGKLRRSCGFHPNIRIKTLGFGKHLIGLQRSKKVTYDNVHFVDVMTLGGALLGDYLALDDLCRVLNVSIPQSRSAFRKVQQEAIAIFTCYAELLSLYQSYQLDRPVWNLYSGASVGKALFHQLGIRPFLEQHPSFPPKMISWSLAAQYGGRAEINVRREVVPVEYLDFDKQYPTVCSLMNLQELLNAERIDTVNTTEWVTELLNMGRRALLDWVHDKAHWPLLFCLVRISPSDHVLPVRMKFGDYLTTAMPKVIHGSDEMIYCLADVIYATLHADHPPTVIEAYSFIPSKEHYQTKSIDLLGTGSMIDLEKDDLFMELIHLRDHHKYLYRKTGRESHHYQQLAIKLSTNALASGVFMELNSEDFKQEMPVKWIDPDGVIHDSLVRHMENPGEYFAPFGCFITAGGRLLLGIAEELYREHDIAIASCDTDGFMPIMKAGSDIGEKVRQWFDALRPGFLRLENENFKDGTLKQLYFIGISTKRYALFRRGDDNRIDIAKISRHVLGNYILPYNDNESPLESIPHPTIPLEEMGCKRWEYDIWYRYITTVLREETTESPSNHPAFEVPSKHLVEISTIELLKIYGKRGARPFDRFVLLPPVHSPDYEHDEMEFNQKLEAWSDWNASGTTFYSKYPFDAAKIRTSIGNKAVPEWFRPTTMAESLRGFFMHSENQFNNGTMTGIMERRTVLIEEVIFIGKETNELSTMIALESGGLLGFHDQLFLQDSDLSTAHSPPKTPLNEYDDEVKRKKESVPKAPGEAARLLLKLRSEYIVSRREIARLFECTEDHVYRVETGQRVGKSMIGPLTEVLEAKQKQARRSMYPVLVERQSAIASIHALQARGMTHEQIGTLVGASKSQIDNIACGIRSGRKLLPALQSLINQASSGMSEPSTQPPDDQPYTMRRHIPPSSERV